MSSKPSEALSDKQQGISVAFVSVFTKIAKDKNLLGPNNKITHIDSFGTDSYHVGQDPDHRTVAECRKNNVPIKHHAQQFQTRHFDEFNYVICMDDYNQSSLLRKKPKGSKSQVYLFGHWREDPKFDVIVDDPYYGGVDGFKICYKQCCHFSEVFLKRELEVEI
ncbi:unnamed protein product [Ambrosiozyma monospora]|uniref:Unnamed protein product n=1 Tax=Ambrosiozyma monospora TaxID=43982 RepID=A0A9W6Z6R6_AMBMO|nr:unnamed protein product [Ambrosiozyma monospora]